MSNVRDFGAVGDGEADDTEAIQHAVSDGEGIVEFPRGNYRISKTILVDLSKESRTSLVGRGGVAKIVMHGPGPAIFLKGSHASSADPGGFRPEEWQHERMPTIDGIEIEGQHFEADGIRIVGVMQPTLTRVLIRQVRTAVHVTDRARNLIVDGCHFYHNTGVGIHLDRVNLHQTIIADSHISYCRRGGIRIEDSEIRNLQITGNDIEYNTNRVHREKFPDDDDLPTAEIYIDVVNGTVREGTISSNTIQAQNSPNGANIRMIGSGPEGTHRAGMWTISGNLIGSQRINVHLTSVRGVTISGNYIYSGHHRNVLIEGSRNVVLGENTFGHNPDYKDKELATGIRISDSDNINLNGFLIQDAQAGQHTVDSAEPIQRGALVEIVRCKRVNMTGCQVLDGTPTGLLIDDCEDTLVSSCSIIDQREDKLMKTGVDWRGSTHGNMLVQSRIGGAGKAVAAPAGLVQSGNLAD
ncbi:MAG: right-handed parallel beta-helix repeat-containing protein [Planctomycetota bacterium]|nr:right-handed parallel beta-helix repeat-containing protein [Planctomycetota bacterium]MDA1249645.1 right-handed parallel beta-helix repeat-containing protein [Planctomycetota bacterium]